MDKKLYILLLLAASFMACNDYLDIEPVGKVIPKTVDDYRSFLTSAYAKTKNHKVLATYRADELIIEKEALGVEQYRDIYLWNDAKRVPSTLNFSYASFYTTIFHTNHIISQASTIQGKAEAVNQLVGEAYALRALQYFDLVNLYAKPYDKTTSSTDKAVPLVTKYDSEKEYPRQTVQKVYDLILDDIQQSEKLLTITRQKIGYNYRFSVVALKSLKARVYLYMQNWSEAVKASQEALAINNNLQDLNTDVSVMPSEYNSVESILALDVVSSFDMSTQAAISKTLIDAYDKVGDLRFKLYFSKNSNGIYTTKKNANTKYKITFRTSELYLILMEAYWHLNNFDKAKEELIKFTKNRLIPTKWKSYKTMVMALANNALYDEILNERKRELAIEGHRWFDLRRTTQPKIIKTFDGVIYTLSKNDHKYIIPFPADAVVNNPYLNQ